MFFWHLPRSLGKYIFDRSVPKVATGCFSSVWFCCRHPYWPEGYYMLQLLCDVYSSCLSRVIMLRISDPNYFYAVVSGSCTMGQSQGGDLCRFFFIVHLGKSSLVWVGSNFSAGGQGKTRSFNMPPNCPVKAASEISSHRALIDNEK